MHFARSLLVSLALTLAAGPALAGPYSDDLGKCLVSSASAQDQIDLMTWMFAAVSLNPAIAKYSSITDDQRITINQTAGALFSRLITKDCHDQTVAALKNEGVMALSSSFGLFGQVASRGLMTSPAVSQSMQALGTDLDQGAMQAVMKEAGLSK